MYSVFLTKQAQKDLLKLKSAGLSLKAKAFVDICKINPFQNPPPYEKLVGKLGHAYSRRINLQHRFVYTILPNTQHLKDPEGIEYIGHVSILSMWSHYETL